MIIKTLGDFRKLTSELSDDYEIELRVRRHLSDEELKKLTYPYPFETAYQKLEYDDVGVSDKVICVGVEIPIAWSDFISRAVGQTEKNKS